MIFFTAQSEQKNSSAAADPARAALGFERWHDAAGACGDVNTTKQAEAILGDAKARGLLEAVFGCSPYLTQSIVSDLTFTCSLFKLGPEQVMKDVLANVTHARSSIAATGEGTAALARVLRQAKRRASLAIALADISGLWQLQQVTGALSDLAEASISAAAAHLLAIAASQGALVLEDPQNPERGTGLVILGMGKLGARELNYSSDIDLIILYDPERLKTDNAEGLQNHFVRLARGLVKLLEERTADGYVFRTDLRLRPDPGATPLAISVLAAENYYESIGQNWERAAMIKARPVAGDKEAGDAFLKWLTPFIWRKNLDFAAIEDIHSIKRQINAHRGGEAISVAGHNVKLGRGGIREIEFFAQTQQLIWGGRTVELRPAPTEQSLSALAQWGQITDTVCSDMIAAYRYLRRVEHRLQMIDDEQTHSLPDDKDGVAALATFLGYPDSETFATQLTGQLKTVEAHYGDLFEDAPSLGADDAVSGNLVFTGGDSDPETIKTIERLGFAHGDIVDTTVRGWHHGRYRCMRNARARELLTELFPALLKAIAATPDPDATFLKFDEFLSGLPSGVQLFSMFYANPGLLDLVGEIMGGAPRLAEYLSRRPQVLDSVLSPGFFDNPPSKDEMTTELERILERSDNLEDVLVATRRWANDRRFQVGVLSLLMKLGQVESSLALSDIADTAILALFARVEDEMAVQHGRIAGSAMAILAMGKLGSREMTPESDLDLVFVYDTPPDSAGSDGAKPLSPGHYFARLSQRLINAITAQTSEGDLYEVDMRLRPSGTAGPIASSLESFNQYNDEAAWTWEQMALTRCRIISAWGELEDKISTIIEATLTRRRDPDTLLMDIAGMRTRMLQTHQTDFIWDVKHIRGGLVDVEFITQYLQLRHAHDHPDILAHGTRAALEKLADKELLDADVYTDLTQGLELWQALQGMLRLTIPRQLRQRRDHDIPESLLEKLARIGGVADLAALKKKMGQTAAKVLKAFNTIIAEPAEKLL
ncbi:MAG: bifunctional [glutamine synthetase] adenylyltransferase/[glutamine synthetase]-adenylyl-L-tyrosine phosphorylase [Rhodospirillales bacterium]|nr:bifunctional [glutamine synthetase] adenylyltransferase/[glutamine synthetase]-adenylyl-L-tyrosine phosphorylase [Rhodospirillales bacterium]